MPSFSDVAVGEWSQDQAETGVAKNQGLPWSKQDKDGKGVSAVCGMCMKYMKCNDCGLLSVT